MVRTNFIYPPVPVRSSDWMAWIDEDEEGVVGYGTTELDALADLFQQLAEAARSHPSHNRRTTMAKTFYLGFTKSGLPVGRASANDYGYRFAAYHPDRSGSCFSRTASGALTYIGRGYVTAEIVEVKVVTGKEYRDAMKAAKDAE